tara:strand:+ start:12 stop:662 length:651 start_codon:yes stop_codon:yes gene_type:complete
MRKKKLIFCLGTGRCATSSMAFLLNSQHSSLFTHELFPILPWENEKDRCDRTNSLIQFKFNQLTHQSHNYDIVGDSGSYYLPYVEVFARSIMHSEEFDFKFIILKRDKLETIESFKTKFKRQNNNPLQNHSGPKNEWDASFPKYDECSLDDAIEKYYDDYYSTSAELSEKFPKNVRIFNSEILNSDKGLTSLFEFLDIENPLMLKNIRKNSSSDAR